jgi:cytochrome c
VKGKAFTMKNKLIIAAVVMLCACKSGAGKTAASDSPNATLAIINTGGTSVDSAQGISGANLIAANDCLTCHKINEKSFGPSYKQIADKYQLNQGNLENLADRIIKGGKGLWGQNAMTPHPALSEANAERMAQYILLLRDSTGTLK